MDSLGEIRAVATDAREGVQVARELEYPTLAAKLEDYAARLMAAADALEVPGGVGQLAAERFHWHRVAQDAADEIAALKARVAELEERIPSMLRLLPHREGAAMTTPNPEGPGLLPCPFCGLPAEVFPQYCRDDRYGTFDWVRCPNGHTADFPIEKWNTRVGAHEIADEIAALEGRIEAKERMIDTINETYRKLEKAYAAKCIEAARLAQWGKEAQAGPTLNVAEREAIEWALGKLAHHSHASIPTLRILLDRTKAGLSESPVPAPVLAAAEGSAGQPQQTDAPLTPAQRAFLNAADAFCENLEAACGADSASVVGVLNHFHIKLGAKLLVAWDAYRALSPGESQ